MLEYLKKIINGASQESSKRFMGVVAILLFSVLYLELIILLPLVIFRVIPASQTTVNLYFGLFEQMSDHIAYIIYFVIGAVMVVAGVDMISKVFHRKATAEIITAEKGTPETQVTNENVQQQNVGGGSSSNIPAQTTPKDNLE